MSDPAHTADFFRQPLGEMIDLGHPLAVLASRLPWTQIEAVLAPCFARQAREGRTIPQDDLFGPSQCSLDATKWNRGLCGTPTTVSATRSTTAAIGHGGEVGAALRQRLAKAGLLLDWVSWNIPLALQRHAFRQPSERGLGFRGSLSCRLGHLLTRRLSDVLPRFHFVASRLRWLRRHLGRFTARRDLRPGGGTMFAMGKLAALVDRRGLQGNFYCPTPFARRLHAGDIHGCACNTLISMDNCVCDTCRALSS